MSLLAMRILLSEKLIDFFSETESLCFVFFGAKLKSKQNITTTTETPLFYLNSV